MATVATETNAPETHQFQAEIRQLLDIVIHSLYTNREIFVRELVSNAADALEKARHEFLIHPELPESDRALEIRIRADKDAGALVFEDTGIGMTRDELSRNLGTIAHSGTKEFLRQAVQAAKQDVHLIGQFGVGFYSAFMVASRVRVESRALAADAQGWAWESDGAGSYTIAPADDAPRGTRITLTLKDDAKEFAEASTLKDIIRRFSSFVPFPVLVDGEKANTVQALWTRPAKDITEEEYQEFYKFIANAWDEPLYRLHFSADAPLAINSLLFVPGTNMERFGFGRMEPGVDLYCRKVMIQKHPEHLLPEWLRFLRGVIDSDDLPLNISRESLQDSALIRKLSKVITGRFLKMLNEEATKDPEKFAKFHETFGRFIREGIVTDFTHRAELAKLLRFETSFTEAGKTASLADYVGRMKDGQKEIYFLAGPSREAIEASPYMEALRARGLEVLYLFDATEDFVLDQVGEFEGKPLKSAERADLELPEHTMEQKDRLSDEEADALCKWLKETLGGQIGEVKVSKRLSDSPAVITTEGGMSATMQRLLRSTNPDAPRKADGDGATLEINPGHPLARRVYTLREANGDLAKDLAEQLLDNALLGAGLLSNPQRMVARLNRLLAQQG